MADSRDESQLNVEKTRAQTTVEKQEPVENISMENLRKVLRQTVKSFTGNLKLIKSLNGVPYAQLEQLHSKAISQLETNILCEFEQTYKEVNLEMLLGTLDKIKAEKSKQSDTVAWRPSGNVKRDVSSEVALLKREKLNVLKNTLSGLEAQNKLLIDKAQKEEQQLLRTRDKILSIAEDVEESLDHQHEQSQELFESRNRYEGEQRPEMEGAENEDERHVEMEETENEDEPEMEGDENADEPEMEKAENADEQHPEIEEAENEDEQRPEMGEAENEDEQHPEMGEAENEDEQRPEMEEAENEDEQFPEIEEAENEDEQRPELEEAENEDDINKDDNFLSPELVQQLPPDTECLVCLSHIRDIVFKECGHLLFCQNCYIFYTRCPICNVKVRTWVKADWDIQ